jgi:hypothetical protein
MSNFNVNPLAMTSPGFGPFRFSASTTDSLETITGTGYMTDQIHTAGIRYNDKVAITYSFNEALGSSIYGEFLMQIVDGVGTLVPWSGLGDSPNYDYGLAMVSQTGTTMQFLPGSITNGTNTYQINIPGITTVNLATNGFNGLDTGTQTANTPIFVYAIGDSTGVNPSGMIASTSAAGPLLPTGYDASAFIYATFNLTGSAALPLVITSGLNANGLIVQYQAAIVALTAGAATTLTGLDLTTPVRAVPTIPFLRVNFGSQTSAGGTFAMRDTGNTTATTATAPFRTADAGAASGRGDLTVGVNGSSNPSVDYAVSAGTVNILVNGYTMVV